jgi:hypothetical protein
MYVSQEKDCTVTCGWFKRDIGIVFKPKEINKTLISALKERLKYKRWHELIIYVSPVKTGGGAVTQTVKLDRYSDVLYGPGLIHGRAKFFSYPQRPDRL